MNLYDAMFQDTTGAAVRSLLDAGLSPDELVLLDHDAGEASPVGTLLHYAAACMNAGAVAVLLAAGARSMPDSDGLQPVDRLPASRGSDVGLAGYVARKRAAVVVALDGKAQALPAAPKPRIRPNAVPHGPHARRGLGFGKRPRATAA